MEDITGAISSSFSVANASAVDSWSDPGGSMLDWMLPGGRGGLEADGTSGAGVSSDAASDVLSPDFRLSSMKYGFFSNILASGLASG